MTRRKQQHSKVDVRYLIVVILLLAFVLRVYQLDIQSIWWDEGHSIQMASAPLAQIPTLPGMDVHPPGYFALLHQWMAVAGWSEFALRYLSLVFSLLTVALLVRFGRALPGRHAGSSSAWMMISVGALAALSPLYVAYAQEVRMYAVVTFFALASVYCQWRIITGPSPRPSPWEGEGAGPTAQPSRWDEEGAGPPPRASRWDEEGAGPPPRASGWEEEGAGPSPRPSPSQGEGAPTARPITSTLPGARGSLAWPLAGYVLATAASLYTHYFTIFLLVFQNLAWLAWALGPRLADGQRRGRMGVWLSGQLATWAVFLPQLPLALRQTTSYANPNLNPPGLGEFLSRSWLAYTVGAAVDPATSRYLGGALAVLMGLALLARVANSLRGAAARQIGAFHDLQTVAFLVGWLLIPLGTYFLVLQRRPSFEPRYMMLVTPALMLLLAWGLGLETGARYRRLWWGGLGMLLATAVLGLGTWVYFTNLDAYKDDSTGVAAWLAAETTPDDVVYVDVPHPFHYYADRIPAPTRYLFVDVHTAADALNTEAAGRDRLFWVTWWGSDTDPRGVIPFLLDKAGQRAGEIDFRGYHVTGWQLSPDARFSLPNDLAPVSGSPQGAVDFGDVIRLDGLASAGTAQVSGSAWATLHFSLLRDTDVDIRISLRLRGPGGNVLLQTDKDLLNDRHFRTSAWPLDDPRLNQAINVYTLPIPPGTRPGDYHLEAVVYDAATLGALPVTGIPAPDGISAPLGSVVISP